VARNQCRCGVVVQWNIRRVASPVKWVVNVPAGKIKQFKQSAIQRDADTLVSAVKVGCQFDDDQANTSHSGDEKSWMYNDIVKGISMGDAPTEQPATSNAARLPMILEEAAEDEEREGNGEIGETTLEQSTA
jgi:hypothetical protein